MAQCLRRPVLAALGPQSSAPIQQRCFRTASSQRLASQQSIMPRQPLSPSIRLQAKEKGVVPSDIGILPNTIIAPSGPNRPSLFRNPRGAIGFQYSRLLQHVRDILGLLYYKYSVKPRPKLGLRRAVPAAVGLHRQMYAAFAEGDLMTLKKICADGLRESLGARISRRGKERWTWELIRYTKSAKVMSHKGVSLGRDGMAIRQAVVRISSLQRLTRCRPDGEVIPGTGQEKKVMEYLVIQKRMLGGKEGDWHVWGTTEETTLEKLEEQQRAELE